MLSLCDMDDLLEHLGLIHRREFSLHTCYSEGSRLYHFWSQFGKLGVLELHCVSPSVSQSVRLSHLVSAITCITSVTQC